MPTQLTTIPAIVPAGRLPESSVGLFGCRGLESELDNDCEVGDYWTDEIADELVDNAAVESDVASKAYVVSAGVAEESGENISLSNA